MHILIIPSWYKSSDDPLLGSFFEEQARAFIRLGHKAGIIFADFHPPSAVFRKKNNMPEFIDDNGLPTYSIAAQTFFPLFRPGNYWMQGKLADGLFKQYIKKYGMPDVIHSHSAAHGGVAAFYLSKKYKIPHVITEHLTTIVSDSIKHPYDYKYTRELFRCADKALVVSHTFKDVLVDALRLHPDCFEVVHNMVNDLFFESFQPKTYNDSDDFIFLTNSFLKKRKNHKLLFDALKILIKRVPDVKLRVGGYGPEDEDLRNYVKSHRLDKHVEFLGLLNRKDVKQQIDNSHAFVLPSSYETFGVVLIESLACGRPVASTDSKGPRDIINDENGIISKSFEAADLADAMEQLMLNYSTYDQQKISDNCRSNFSERIITEKLINIYEDVCDKRKKGFNPLRQKEKKDILLTFDYELFLGSRSGSIEDCMINTTKKILKILRPYPAKAIFFVDTSYLIRLKEYSKNYPKCKEDFNTIADQLQQIIIEGHYIFPHIHPHWLDAVYNPRTNEWNVENAVRYRFHNISESDRSYLFNESVEVLREIIFPIVPSYQIDSFRAGGWSVQPFSDFKPHFLRHNLKYDFSVLDRAFQFTAAQYYDFSYRPDKLIYRFEDDVCEEDYKGKFTQFVNSTIKISSYNQTRHRVLTKFNQLAKSEMNVDIGQGQVNVKQLNGSPKSERGYPATGAGHLYLSIDHMSMAYLAAYKKELRSHYYLHFVSHPKMIKQISLKRFAEFLKYAYDHFKIETDYKKMAE